MRLFQHLMAASRQQFLEEEHEAMYSTLMILQFYKNTKLKSQKWLEETTRAFQQNKPKLYQHARWIINLYLKNAEDGQFALNFLSSVILINQKFSWQIQPGQQIQQALKEASGYHDLIELRKKDKHYKKMNQIAYNLNIKQSKIATFSYCCFLDYLRSINCQPKKKLWALIVDNLKGLIHAMRFTTKAYQLLTCYIFLIKNFLRFYGCCYEQILKQLMFMAVNLRNSVGVNAYIAHQLFLLAQNELKLPGTTLRRQIKRRFPNIDSRKADSVGGLKYLLTNQKINLTTPEYCSLLNLRKLVIYNVFGSCKAQNIGRLYEIIQKMDPELTYLLYFKITKITQIANNLQNYESVQKMCRQSVADLMSTSWKSHRKIRQQQIEQLQELIINEHIQRFFQFPNFQIKHVKIQHFNNPKYQYSLQELIQINRQYPFNQVFYSTPLEFIMMLNDQQINQVLQKICPILVQMPPGQFQKLAFYILPLRQGLNYLAQYMSYKDLWYKRYVFNAFKEKLFFPNISLEDIDFKDSFPSYIITKTVHMYIRQAQRKAPIQIYQCQLSYVQPQVPPPKDQPPKPRVIYFINHLLMGASAQIQLSRLQQRNKDKKSINDILQLYLQKIKKVYSLSLDISIRYKQPGSDLLLTKQQKYFNVQDIQICNTPRQYFFGYKPNPFSQFIQISLLSSQASKIFRNQLQSKQNFKRHSDEEIGECFRDLFINLSAQSIVIERSEGMRDSIKMLIDGIQINMIDKMKITPAFTSSKLPLTLPLRCFLPFQS